MREIEELNASIGKLHAQIDELKVKGVECKSIGNKIFERMDEINRMLEQLRKIKAKDDEVGKKFGNIRIKGVNQKRKAVSVEIE
ncbi:hypothetical protein D4S03_08455 [bacterium]|nr:MAG: hypothetical protein D4S03_08455 [bacterium]